MGGIFVDDDSTDGTSAVVRDLPTRDTRVRGIQRIDRRGLSSACIEGALSSGAPFIAVMDGDLQHDETLLPAMLERLRGVDFDIAVGLISFHIACSVGVVAHVGVADFIFEHEYRWWLAGIAGVVTSAVWNYAATALFTWRRKA